MANFLTKQVSGHDLEISEEWADQLASGIAESNATVSRAGGGKPLLRLGRQGAWIIGQNDDPVQPGSEWAINPASVGHGWVAWDENPDRTQSKMLGEVLVPVTEKRPPMPDPLPHSTWKEQRVCELACLNGEDEGLEVLYKANSYGGVQAMADVTTQIVNQVRKERGKMPKHLVAVVTLGVDSYEHKKWGKTLKPIITVVDWLTMQGEGGSREEAAEPEVVAAPVAARASAAPRRQRPAGRV